jgi:hypothetical protein
MRIDLMSDVNASLAELGSYVREVNWRVNGTLLDWTRYVPADVQARWASLTDVERGYAYYMADQMSEREQR